MKSRFILRITPGLLACIIVLIVVIAGCKSKSSRPPLSSDEVKTISAEFVKVSSAYNDAWNKHDTNLMRTLYTDDIKYYQMPESNTTGIDNVIALDESVLSESPNIEVQSIATYIDRFGGIDVLNVMNYVGIPIGNYNLFTLRQEKISEVWYMYDMEDIASAGSLTHPKPLQDYTSAWSSGNPDTVASLYATDAIRQDTLFNENQQGSSAIKEFATSFFAWYPGVRLELLKSAELVISFPVRTAGVVNILITDHDGQPCIVHAIILLDTNTVKGQITNERLFYQPDSLIACGWAK